MVFEKVAKILAEYKEIDVSEIRPESTLEELELDSLDTVDLIMQFEDEFQVSLELNDNIKTVADIVKLIQESVGKK
ncbi:acyl carrier protein [Thermocaproicibacter melissae]|uniref:acyl carrier protein n=1 Tax=Thermocaproicibacter melissae TaxID=2966552 RepID=UPI0024B04C8C|nr:acyl carrier protein [Thermocaproicibacter melissae]WBY64666.1 acyl carrier protein [Thermocaproicibacter melissae]